MKGFVAELIVGCTWRFRLWFARKNLHVCRKCQPTFFQCGVYGHRICGSYGADHSRVKADDAVSEESRDVRLDEKGLA